MKTGLKVIGLNTQFLFYNYCCKTNQIVINKILLRFLYKIDFKQQKQERKFTVFFSKDCFPSVTKFLRFYQNKNFKTF